ncbi:mechanosensitive ion channel domain-containing protein [Microlunatus spumicola]|uniref:mechanosensitive ion channel domain-containing protein n=1 Tax=Microlunatus spumicola TaxID=81499 RepID=UPI00195B1C83
MSDLTQQPWFAWAVLVVVGLPVLTIVLTEVEARLVRRRSSMARPVRLLRAFILPVGALLVLLTQIPNTVVSNEGGVVKITATVLGLMVLVFVLSGLNTALFLNASAASWRGRMPSIFIDIVRIIIIGVGLAVLLSVVWGADVGGLFAALGVTSIVLGLILQNALGSIVGGLLLLFEQPFQLGDWIEYGKVRGRIVGVNWRAVHIEVDNGIQIVPNSSLAEGAFTNLSRPTTHYVETVAVTFTENDPPRDVIDLCNEVARGLPRLAPGHEPSTVRTGAGTYATSVPLVTFADSGEANAELLTRLWYAARRANLALNGADIWQGESTADVEVLLRRAASRLRLDPDGLEGLAARMDLERWAPGEVLQRVGQVPTAMRWVSGGVVSLRVPAPLGGELAVLNLGTGDLIGQTALTRTGTPWSLTAVSEVTVLVVPYDVLTDLVRQDNRLARELGQEIDQRKEAVDAARAQTEDTASRRATSGAAERA